MISVCIITKNEETHLKECLLRLANKGFELVVVDTGSDDNSVEVAKKFTSSVYSFEWCDDFSAARNYCIEMASNDNVLVLDTDEYIVNCNAAQLEKLMLRNAHKVGRITIENEYMGNGNKMISLDKVSRLFDRREFVFSGRIHEQIVRKDGQPHETYIAPVTVHHYGYNGSAEKKKEKAERNLRLLKRELENNPDDAYYMYQIGKSYYYSQNYIDAIEYFEMAIEKNLDLRLEYVADMIIIYGYSLINSNQVQKAMRLEALYEDYCNNPDFLFVLALIYMRNAKFDLAVELFLQATKYDESSVEGVTSYMSFYNIGVIYECLGDKKTALRYYCKCGNYKPAKEGKRRCH